MLDLINTFHKNQQLVSEPRFLDNQMNKLGQLDIEWLLDKNICMIYFYCILKYVIFLDLEILIVVPLWSF